MNTDKHYAEASIKTANNLRHVAQTTGVQELSRLSLPEIDAVVDLVGDLIPAGNVPGVILSGLSRLAGRRPPADRVKRDIALLFRGVEEVLDKAIYGTVFAGPAAIIWGYQNLLKLAGKDIEDAFPDGTWQFYVTYALREDTARHTNETHGFDTALNQHHIRLDPIDRMTAWTMAAIHGLHNYNSLMENEWRERVYTSSLQQITAEEADASQYKQVYANWEKQRPYVRGRDTTAVESYPVYRRARFDRFFRDATANLPPHLKQHLQQLIAMQEAEDLPAYQQQMSILAYLEPGAYGETRIPIALSQTFIGIIYQGHYYLIPTCAPDSDYPIDVTTVREQIAALVRTPSQTVSTRLTTLATRKRTALYSLRDKLSPALVQELDTLRVAPILINFDQRPRQLPLAEIRQAERGIGDHALTLFDTGETFVFDQSHIFFDGAWGAAFTEIMTNEALSWGVYLNALPPAKPGKVRPYSPAFQIQAADLNLIRQAPAITAEVGVETEVINLKALLSLRKLFRSRNDLIQLTVNDLLVLYRAFHAVTYQPSNLILEELETLAADSTTRQAALAALDDINHNRGISPAILIPIDASQHAPRERLYPMTFEVPLYELDLLNLHEQVMAALDEYQHTSGDRSEAYARFDESQRLYLATLAGFGTVLSRAKEIATAGESASTGTIKMLAHMPVPLQRLLDQIPGKIDILNDLIKGREVFSNVGAVVKTSTLTRFITAKDDNDKKTLAWGVISDAKGVMRISLRDFRPHIRLFETAGHKDAATRLAQDYLDSYAYGLNAYIADLQRITLASRETRLARPEDLNG